VSAYPTRRIRTALLAKIFRQDPTHHEIHWLIRSELNALIECPLGLTEYVQLLAQRGTL
jgi:hypothetical protein